MTQHNEPDPVELLPQAPNPSGRKSNESDTRTPIVKVLGLTMGEAASLQNLLAKISDPSADEQSLKRKLEEIEVDSEMEVAWERHNFLKHWRAQNHQISEGSMLDNHRPDPLSTPRSTTLFDDSTSTSTSLNMTGTLPPSGSLDFQSITSSADAHPAQTDSDLRPEGGPGQSARMTLRSGTVAGGLSSGGRSTRATARHPGPENGGEQAQVANAARNPLDDCNRGGKKTKKTRRPGRQTNQAASAAILDDASLQFGPDDFNENDLDRNRVGTERAADTGTSGRETLAKSYPEVLSGDMLLFLQLISTFSKDTLLPVDAPRTSTSTLSIVSSIVDGIGSVSSQFDNQRGLLRQTILALVAAGDLEKQEAKIQFSYWINIITFVALYNLECRTRLSALKDAQLKAIKTGLRRKKIKTAEQLTVIAEREVLEELKSSTNLCSKTIKRYIADGTAATLLASAASIYFLFLMACARVRPNIRRISSQVGRLSRELRSPTDSPAGNIIKKTIIPSIAHLRQIFPLTLDQIMPSQFFIDENHIGGRGLECTDITATDEFFKKVVISHVFYNDRDCDAWAACQIPLQTPTTWTLSSLGAFTKLPSTTPDSDTTNQTNSPLPAPQWSQTPNIKSDSISIINTKYQPKHEANRFTFARGSTANARKLLHHQTEHERGLACMAKPLKGPVEIQRTLSQTLRSGTRSSRQEYHRINTSTHANQVLRINDADGNPLVISVPTMPEHLRQNVLDHIKLIFPNQVKHTDSKKDGINNTFSAIHFVWYNRYSEKAQEDTPVDQYPGSIIREGNTRPINMSQKEPRTSQELNDFSLQYVALEGAMEQIFDWLHSTMKTLLPKEYEVLQVFADILPGRAYSPVYPFTGFVINFNVATRIHRDWKDQNICLVMPIFEETVTTGGEFCIYELGLVFGLRSMDALFFTSSKLTHFNLNYEGERVSLVFHSDASGSGWVKDRNGWKNNKYLMSSYATCSTDREKDDDDDDD